MAQEVKDGKILIYEDAADKAILEGSKAVYKAVSTTYGPKGKNFLIEKVYGRPTLTRDGVTVAKEVYFKDRPTNAAAHFVTEASLRTNTVAGDGTTATVVLMYNLIKEAMKQKAAGLDPMVIRDELNKDAITLLEKVGELSQPLKEGQLTQVATVSSGDPLLGQLIAEAVEKVGENGGIITEKAHISGVEREYVDGYYLQNGFTAITEGRRVLEDAYVVVSAKRISSHIDALEIMGKIDEAVTAQHNGQPQKLRIAFIGEFEGDAYKLIVEFIRAAKLDAVIIGTPSTGEMGEQYLEDIALYTNATVLGEADTVQSFTAEHVGKANRIICNQYMASIFSDSGIPEDIKSRVAQLKQRLETEESEFLAEKIKDRLAKLEGKIALFKIGGATETEKDEKEFRIEDAIQASRAAYGHGVVPGGGTTLLRLSETPGISPIFKGALVNTFKKLMKNAGLPADVKVNEVLAAKAPMGINLRKGPEVVDLVKEGVLDPTLVVEQIITNASANAGNAITIGGMAVFEDREAK